MEKSETQFISDLADKSITISHEILEYFDLQRVDRFYNFLLSKNSAGGFFSSHDSSRVAERHILEGMVAIGALIKATTVSRETVVADAGSGPGLPGFLFYCLKESPLVTLIDSSRRRLGMLERFYQDLGSEKADGENRVNFIYSRLEEIKGAFDLITIRALIPFPFCLELICRLVKENGYVSYFAADNTPTLDGHESYLYGMGFSLQKIIPLEGVEFIGSRNIYLLKKSGRTDRQYPRQWKKIKSEIT